MVCFTQKSWNLAMQTLLLFWLVGLTVPSSTLYAANGELDLNELIAEGLRNNPEILAAQSRAQAAGYRIPQAKALPDPMFMFGYQNEGFDKITLGEEPDAYGMFSLSQMFPFPGKRALKGEMATKDMESLQAMHKATQLKIAATVKQLYYDLFLAYKNIDILRKTASLFSRIEDAAKARYASGMGQQQEIVMAQTEKYMLLEKEAMQKQKIEAVTGMLNSAIGRDAHASLARPAEIEKTPYPLSLEGLIEKAKKGSPEIGSREKMAEAADAKVRMAKKEYYPDFTIGANYYPRTNGFMDMASLTATINIPIFYKTKQEPAVLEANANLLAAKRELASTRFMLFSAIRENYSMAETGERLLTLYREGIAPKIRQDFQLALSGYAAGKVEAITAISRLKAFLDTELLYWGQFVEREKAIARLQALTGEEIVQGGHQAYKGSSFEGGTR
ncbi:MAG: Cobalt-zinc-cadmium resistance protein CzcC precursor [Syntrophorhabdus sp. PtaU1.Bin153]|nr:MAG: Cobalt-zinc-cadmium resistance protein CzcC precursor [Syntrophorhabdus sp. PtaU1.Bin153]